MSDSDRGLEHGRVDWFLLTKPQQGKEAPMRPVRGQMDLTIARARRKTRMAAARAAEAMLVLKENSTCGKLVTKSPSSG